MLSENSLTCVFNYSYHTVLSELIVLICVFIHSYYITYITWNICILSKQKYFLIGIHTLLSYWINLYLFCYNSKQSVIHKKERAKPMVDIGCKIFTLQLLTRSTRTSWTRTLIRHLYFTRQEKPELWHVKLICNPFLKFQNSLKIRKNLYILYI